MFTAENTYCPPGFAPKRPQEAIDQIVRLYDEMNLLMRNDYWWQSKWLQKTEFGKAMSRDRFNLIRRYLHLTNIDIPAATNCQRFVGTLTF